MKNKYIYAIVKQINGSFLMKIRDFLESLRIQEVLRYNGTVQKRVYRVYD